MNVSLTTINIIQAMLAPGLMISACGLLILSMNNKYSMVVGRIRLLNEERRRIGRAAADDLQRRRLENVGLQLAELLHRLQMVRNAVVGYCTAVGLFIASSLFIGLRILAGAEWPASLALVLFIVGMLTVLVGIGYAAAEALTGYRIVKLEVAEGQKRTNVCP